MSRAPRPPGHEHRRTNRRLEPIWIAENLRESRVSYHLRLIAHGKGGTTSRALTITIPGEPPFVTGFWSLTIVSSSPAIVGFEPDGLVTVPEDTKDEGLWTYKHRTLKFTIAIEVGTYEFEASGPPGGPFIGTVKLGANSGPFKLERTS